ncbi:transmembrane protein 192 isoform X2 [Pseudomyrmex gracilis]|uniref:transmembrane protein 192 isoform X2 n=1 Tax=Pseudomyrmex gracilis TaxID=219809 RepID=UPI0009955DC7|nr:transmembrane protein 192 isoform X2 [Pseudomyrmex gracilis]
MEEEHFFQAFLSSQEEINFQVLSTVPIVSISLLFGVLLEITGIIFISVWPEEQNKCNTYFIYLYLHCAYWLVVMVADHLVKTKHHKLRINGYLDFYQTTYRLIRIPFFITSLWNTCYLFLTVILHHTHKVDYEKYCRMSEWFTPLNYIFLLTSIELVIILPAYVNYIKSVMQFNRLRLPPDVTRDEWMSPITQNSYAGMGEVGYHQRGIDLEELLEKQADLIRYLKDHNVKLSHRIMLLVSQQREAQSEA